MTSPVSGLIQTIVSLKELQQRDEAAKLAREQFGLQQQRFGLEQQQFGEGIVGHLQALAQNVTDPSKLDALVPDLAKASGQDPNALLGILHATPPAVSTTQAAAVASGAKQLAGAADIPAATQALTTVLPGALTADEMHRQIFGGATGYLAQLQPSQRQAFNAQVLQKVGTGMSLGDAAIDTAIANLTPAERTQAARIGKGLAPSASEMEQVKLGWARARLDERQLENLSANQGFEHQIQLAEVRAKLTGNAAKEVNDLIDAKEKALQDFIKNGPTLTPEGVQQKAAQINAYSQQIRAYRPGDKQWEKLFPDLPAGKTPGTTSGFLQFMGKSGLLP